MNHLKLVKNILDVGAISNIASSDSCGSISMFVGTTRNEFEGKKVLRLEYEAYEPMALKQLDLICNDLRRKWPDIVNIVIYHRLGLVGIREASVVVAISSPHRDSSLRAVAVAIDDIKRLVPIWKKEIYEEDQFAWKENTEFGVVRDHKSNTFDGSMCFIEDPQPPSSNLVQISVPEDELQRRIQCFVEKKRDEINICNIMDFTNLKQTNHEAAQQEKEIIENESMTCARINSIVVKQEYSKCHLKVRRVENNVGPQTQPKYLNALDKLMVSTEGEQVESYLFIKKNGGKRKLTNCEEFYMSKYPTMLERLANIDDYLNIPHSEIKNIYERLKTIEDRLLFLESISPEYAHFLDEKSQAKNTIGAPKTYDSNPMGVSSYDKKIYSVCEIENIVQSFEEPTIEHQKSNTIE